jgi:hypothetical protein
MATQTASKDTAMMTMKELSTLSDPAVAAPSLEPTFAGAGAAAAAPGNASSGAVTTGGASAVAGAGEVLAETPEKDAPVMPLRPCN